MKHLLNLSSMGHHEEIIFYMGPSLGLVETNKNVFGIMNYAFSVPLTVTHKNWSFSFTYTYNIPKALPGEPLTISESSYLSGSLTYFINFKRNKFPL